MRQPHATRLRWQDDPCPPGGIGESLYCTLKARFGYWSPHFLRYVKDYYGGHIPHRFSSIVAKLEREKPWLLPDTAFSGDPPTITMVDSKGNVKHRWRPTRLEWDEAKR